MSRLVAAAEFVPRPARAGDSRGLFCGAHHDCSDPGRISWRMKKPSADAFLRGDRSESDHLSPDRGRRQKVGKEEDAFSEPPSRRRRPSNSGGDVSLSCLRAPLGRREFCASLAQIVQTHCFDKSDTGVAQFVFSLPRDTTGKVETKFLRQGFSVAKINNS